MVMYKVYLIIKIWCICVIIYFLFFFGFSLCVFFYFCDQCLGQLIVFFFFSFCLFETGYSLFCVCCLLSDFVVFNFGTSVFMIICFNVFSYHLCVFSFFLRCIKFNSEFNEWDGFGGIDIGLMIFNTSENNADQVGLVVSEVLIVYDEFEFFILIFVLLKKNNKSKSLEPSFWLTLLIQKFCEFFVFSYFVVCISTSRSLRLVGWLISYCFCCVVCCLFILFLILFILFIYSSLLIYTNFSILFCLYLFCVIVCVYVWFFIFVVFIFWSYFNLQVIISKWYWGQFPIVVLVVNVVMALFIKIGLGILIWYRFSFIFYYYYYSHLLIKLKDEFQGKWKSICLQINKE